MISLTSCFQSRKTELKIISDYCQLHSPLDDELESDVLVFWETTNKSISSKNKNGGAKTPTEKFVEVMTNYAGVNEKKYYEKGCDKL